MFFSLDNDELSQYLEIIYNGMAIMIATNFEISFGVLRLVFFNEIKY